VEPGDLCKSLLHNCPLGPGRGEGALRAGAKGVFVSFFLPAIPELLQVGGDGAVELRGFGLLFPQRRREPATVLPRPVMESLGRPRAEWVVSRARARLPQLSDSTAFCLSYPAREVARERTSL